MESFQILYTFKVSQTPHINVNEFSLVRMSHLSCCNIISVRMDVEGHNIIIMLIEEHLSVGLLIKSNSKSCCIVNNYIWLCCVFKILTTVKSSVTECSLNLKIFIRWRRHSSCFFEAWWREDLSFPRINCKSFISFIYFFLLEHTDPFNFFLYILISIMIVLLSLRLNLVTFFLIIDEFPLECC